MRYNLVASHLTGARRGPDSITAECAKKMNTTFEIEEVSSDFFSALENAELCHGVKRNLALEISRDEPKIGKIGTPKPVIPPFMPLVKRDVAPDEPKIGDPRGDQENLCVPQEGKTTARKRRLPASLSPAANEIQKEGCHDLTKSPVLPDLRFPGSVVLCETPEEVDSAVARIRRLAAIPSAPRTLGWDIEWVVSFKAGAEPRLTALMQLCYRPRAPAKAVCFLLRLCLTGVTEALRELLVDPTVVKVGLNARGDAHKIRRDFNIPVEGVLELREFARERVQPGKAPESYSLAALVEWQLSHRLPKHASSRMSDWEAPKLTDDQVKYAALDGWASLLVFETLQILPPVTETCTTPAPAVAEDKVDVEMTAETVCVDDPWDINQITPAAPPFWQGQLGPAKTETHYLHLDRGWSGAQIAAIKGVQVSTADGYIADAIRAGKAYRFGVLGVTRRALSLVENAWHRHRSTINAEAQPMVTPPPTLQENIDADAGVHRRTIRAVKDILMEQAPGSNVTWAECDFSICHLQRLELLAAGDAASRLQLISPLPTKP